MRSSIRYRWVFDLSTSEGQGYSLAIGREALFGGGVPPVPDNPDTPEDDYMVHRFAFTPIVYRQPYIDAGGDESGYYVMYYWRSTPE